MKGRDTAGATVYFPFRAAPFSKFLHFLLPFELGLPNFSKSDQCFLNCNVAFRYAQQARRISVPQNMKTSSAVRARTTSTTPEALLPAEIYQTKV